MAFYTPGRHNTSRCRRKPSRTRSHSVTRTSWWNIQTYCIWLTPSIRHWNWEKGVTLREKLFAEEICTKFAEFIFAGFAQFSRVKLDFSLCFAYKWRSCLYKKFEIWKM